MNNEPVAWMEADVLPLTHIIKAVVRREQDEQHTIPLYTHPAKTPTLVLDGNRVYSTAKTLTDEEINEIADECFGTVEYELWKQINDFARAILRKAQEK